MQNPVTENDKAAIAVFIAIVIVVRTFFVSDKVRSLFPIYSEVSFIKSMQKNPIYCCEMLALRAFHSNRYINSGF